MSVPATEDARWIGGIVRELIGLLLLGYVLWRRKLRFKDLGLSWSKGTLPTGFGVAAVACASYLAGSFVTHRFFVSFLPFLHGGVTARALFSSSSVMIVPFFLLSPIFEELIVRAYLMTEVQALTGSWTLATFLSVAIQFSYHLYYGWEGALAVSFLFIVFSVYYARTRNATPIIIAHELFDLWGLATLI